MKIHPRPPRALLLLPIAVLVLAAGACRSAAPAAPADPATAPRAATDGEASAEVSAEETGEATAETTAEATSGSDETAYKNTVKWTTASEVDNFGYDVFRSESPDGPFERLNSETIEGAGTVDEPRNYRWVDDTIDPHKTYYYYVESISMAGVREKFTPIGKAPPKIPAEDEEKPQEPQEGGGG